MQAAVFDVLRDPGVALVVRGIKPGRIAAVHVSASFDAWASGRQSVPIAAREALAGELALAPFIAKAVPSVRLAIQRASTVLVPIFVLFEDRDFGLAVARGGVQ